MGANGAVRRLSHRAKQKALEGHVEKHKQPIIEDPAAVIDWWECRFCGKTIGRAKQKYGRAHTRMGVWIRYLIAPIGCDCFGAKMFTLVDGR